MEISREWVATLPQHQRRMASRFKSKKDFAVLGESMPFIKELCRMFDYNLVEVKLRTLDDLRSTPETKVDEESGVNYFDFAIDWQKTIDESEKESLLLFHIDDADDRLVCALKSIVERHGDNYFVGLVCADKTRNIERITVYDLVKPIIVWE